MNYDKDKVDDAALALLYLTLHDGCRAWKGLDWDAMDRLHEKGMIHDPKGKAKSVALTEEGLKRCEELFKKLFCTKETCSDGNDPKSATGGAGAAPAGRRKGGGGPSQGP